MCTPPSQNNDSVLWKLSHHRAIRREQPTEKERERNNLNEVEDERGTRVNRRKKDRNRGILEVSPQEESMKTFWTTICPLLCTMSAGIHPKPLQLLLILNCCLCISCVHCYNFLRAIKHLCLSVTESQAEERKMR